jgi:hypothetical protein
MPNCYWCAITISPGQTRVDRKDTTYSYSLKNCVPCCQTCLDAKGNKTSTEWMNWVKRLVNKWSL